jgi:hypothetical protein
MRRRDPVLRAVLERHAADLVARRPAGDTIARDLAMSVRTPQAFRSR